MGIDVTLHVLTCRYNTDAELPVGINVTLRGDLDEMLWNPEVRREHEALGVSIDAQSSAGTTLPLRFGADSDDLTIGSSWSLRKIHQRNGSVSAPTVVTSPSGADREDDAV